MNQGGVTEIRKAKGFTTPKLIPVIGCSKKRMLRRLPKSCAFFRTAVELVVERRFAIKMQCRAVPPPSGSPGGAAIRTSCTRSRKAGLAVEFN